MKIVIGGDTFPNKWYIEYAADADVAIHEVFLTPDALVQWYGQSPDQAWSVAGPTPPPKPPAPGTVPDPLSDEMKAGKWNPQTEDAQKSLIEAFKKEYNLN